MIRAKMFCLFLGVLLVLLLPALAANAEMQTITGKITGFTCLTRGYNCPIDKADPMIGLEMDFVLVTASGDYYFMPNLGLGIKARHALEVVTVTGDVNAKYKSLKVDKLMVGGKTVWDREAEEEMFKQLERGVH
jgi:hypothetical protein